MLLPRSAGLAVADDRGSVITWARLGAERWTGVEPWKAMRTPLCSKGSELTFTMAS